MTLTKQTKDTDFKDIRGSQKYSWRTSQNSKVFKYYTSNKIHFSIENSAIKMFIII